MSPRYRSASRADRCRPKDPRGDLTKDAPKYKLGHRVWVVVRKRVVRPHKPKPGRSRGRTSRRPAPSKTVSVRCPACGGQGYLIGADGRRWECVPCNAEGSLSMQIPEADWITVECTVREIRTTQRRGGFTYEYVAMPIGKRPKPWEIGRWRFCEAAVFATQEEAEGALDSDPDEYEAKLELLNDLDDHLHESEERRTFEMEEPVA